MNAKFSSIIVALALVMAIASYADAHKKLYSQPIFDGPQREGERCFCDCAPGQPRPILPNKPYYGSGGYAQGPPRPNVGYGNQGGGYATSGSYGNSGGRVTGGY